MPLNTAGRNALLSGGLSNVAVKLSLHTGDPATTGTNEATGGTPAYAKKAVTWNAAASGQQTNNGAVVFDVPAGTYYHLGLWDTTGATFYGWFPLQGATAAAPKLALVESADVTPNTIQSQAHGFAANDRVVFYPVEGGSLPTGLTAGVVYFVIATGLATDVFEVSTTSGGSAVDITAAGPMFVQKVVPETFAAQGTHTIPNAGLTLDATLL